METVKNQQDVQEASGSSKKRNITSVVYVLALLALFALKWCVPAGWGALGFDAVFCAIAVLGSLEFLRAVGGNGPRVQITTPQRTLTVAFAAVAVPLYTAVQMTMSAGFLALGCAFAVYVLLLAGVSVFGYPKSTVKGMASCVFCMIYCGVSPALLSALNHLADNSMAALLALFLCTMFTDSFAYIFGKLLKKHLPKKLASNLSPNKTWVGAVGGLLGGIIGGILAYVLIYYIPAYNGVSLVYESALPGMVAFVLIGLVIAVLAQIGDLFESALKRECGLKDTGNVLPGHGGVLDRFDSTLYCSVVALLCFGLLI